MVPDFDELRDQNGDRTSDKQPKSNHNNGFGPKKSSQRFANDAHNHANSEKVETADSEFTDEDQQFFRLWLEQPSWSPIIKNQDGWKTAVSPDGQKKVPLTLGSIKSHYRRYHILGKRFSRLTNYLLIDIDIDSPYHPRNRGIKPILDVMESLGLCRYIVIRSSTSDGIHIYFPLAEPVSSWGLADTAHAALTAAGVKIGGGICELFPNRKSYNAEYNGHRLPLQEGSFILDDDFRCSSNSRAIFMQQWQLCATGQDDKLVAEVIEAKPLPVQKPVSIGSLPPIAWTDKSESNEVMKKLVNYGDRYVGLKTVPALADWIVAVAPQLPGFYEFASQESKNDLTRRNWAYRWAKSHFKSVRMYNAKSSGNHNAVVAAEALERLKIALGKIVIGGKISVRNLWKGLSVISKTMFGVGFSWRSFQKHRKLIAKSVGSLCNLGLSRGSLESINSFSSESAEPLKAGASQELEKSTTQLITARSVTAIQDEALSASPPPSEPAKTAPDEEAELTMGTAVIFQQPGSNLESIETRVTGKTVQLDGTLLYRLEECAEGKPLMVVRQQLTAIAPEASEPTSAGAVIRATAAQLLQVLGKACPFVGPGLWTVRRSDVTPKVWTRLQALLEPM